MDETLVYATKVPLAYPAAFTVGPYHVYLRPHLESFLAMCREWFIIGVWTSSSPMYAAGIVAALFAEAEPPAFVWASNRCTWRRDVELYEDVATKDLKKLRRKGWRPEQVIVIDDSPEKWTRSYGNLVRVSPYTGGPNDDELRLLTHYLEKLRHEPNPRRVEKRFWRQTALRNLVEDSGAAGTAETEGTAR